MQPEPPPVYLPKTMSIAEADKIRIVILTWECEVYKVKELNEKRAPDNQLPLPVETEQVKEGRKQLYAAYHP